jgi:hypothetical protein
MKPFSLTVSIEKIETLAETEALLARVREVVAASGHRVATFYTAGPAPMPKVDGASAYRVTTSQDFAETPASTPAHTR